LERRFTWEERGTRPSLRRRIVRDSELAEDVFADISVEIARRVAARSSGNCREGVSLWGMTPTTGLPSYLALGG
jgi:hypothetical protein